MSSFIKVYSLYWLVKKNYNMKMCFPTFRIVVFRKSNGLFEWCKHWHYFAAGLIGLHGLSCLTVPHFTVTPHTHTSKSVYKPKQSLFSLANTYIDIDWKCLAAFFKPYFISCKATVLFLFVFFLAFFLPHTYCFCQSQRVKSYEEYRL